jgi:hypothetical protein
MRDMDRLVEAIGFTQAQVASTCTDGHDMTPPPELLTAIDAVRTRLVEGDEAIEVAWGVIANASGGNWERESPEWQAAAARWRDRFVGPKARRAAENSDSTSVVLAVDK